MPRLFSGGKKAVLLVIFVVSITVEVKKWGNSFGVLIPSKTVKKLELSRGEKVNLDITSLKRISGFGIAKGAKSFKREIEEREF